jgi:hypothetical protein
MVDFLAKIFFVPLGVLGVLVVDRLFVIIP